MPASKKSSKPCWRRVSYKREMKNIVLIGMPGVGKSSIGVILAKALGMRFMDTDLVIQEREGCLLRDILAQRGIDGFLRIEEEVNASLEEEQTVIATGGSVVYSEKAMAHLGEGGLILYLKLPYDALEERLGDLHNRGVVLREGQTLRHLYDERIPLYERYADLIVDESGLNIEETLTAILEALRVRRPESNFTNYSG